MPVAFEGFVAATNEEHLAGLGLENPQIHDDGRDLPENGQEFRLREIRNSQHARTMSRRYWARAFVVWNART